MLKLPIGRECCEIHGLIKPLLSVEKVSKKLLGDMERTGIRRHGF